MNPAFKGNQNYAKNTPVTKAGILQVINGKPNIVGRKLLLKSNKIFPYLKIFNKAPLLVKELYL